MNGLIETAGEAPRAAVPASECGVVEDLVAAAFGVAVEALRAPERGPAAQARARQVAMYLAHVGLGMKMTEIGRHFGRDRSTVAYACARVEDRRDDLTIERALAFLEEALAICVAAEREAAR